MVGRRVCRTSHLLYTIRYSALAEKRSKVPFATFISVISTKDFPRVSDIRYGIIGSGMMGVEHILNLNAVDGTVVTALADPHEPSIAAGVEAADGEVSTYSDYRALLESGDCDAVVIASPNFTHVDVMLDVLDTDHHILVEKPLCTTVPDCQKVLAAAEGRKAKTWVGLEYRYMPPVTALIDEVHSGTVGTIHMVAIREHRFPFLEKVGDWNRFSRKTGGTLVEKTCHYFDLMNHITQAKPVRVYASGGQSVNHLDETYDGETPDILDNAFVIVDFDTGARGLLDLNMFAEATFNQEELSVVGDKGKVESLIPEHIMRIGRRGEHYIGDVEVRDVRDDSIGHVGFHHGSSFIEHSKLRDAIVNNTEPEVTLQDGLLSVAVGAAAHKSIDEGRAVTLDEVL